MGIWLPVDQRWWDGHEHLKSGVAVVVRYGFFSLLLLSTHKSRIFPVPTRVIENYMHAPHQHRYKTNTNFKLCPQTTTIIFAVPSSPNSKQQVFDEKGIGKDRTLGVEVLRTGKKNPRQDRWTKREANVTVNVFQIAEGFERISCYIFTKKKIREETQPARL